MSDCDSLMRRAENCVNDRNARNNFRQRSDYGNLHRFPETHLGGWWEECQDIFYMSWDLRLQNILDEGVRFGWWKTFGLSLIVWVLIGFISGSRYYLVDLF